MAGATSLGDLSVQSFLGEPLHAVIPVQDPASLERDCVRVVPLDDIAQRALGSARVGIAEGPNGPVLVLTTSRSIDEPAMTVGVEVSCSARLRRTYAVLIDPAPAGGAADLAPAQTEPARPAPDVVATATPGYATARASNPSPAASAERPARRRPAEVRRPAGEPVRAARRASTPRLVVAAAPPRQAPPTVETLQEQIVVLEKRVLDLRSKLREGGASLAEFPMEQPPAAAAEAAATHRTAESVDDGRPVAPPSAIATVAARAVAPAPPAIAIGRDVVRPPADDAPPPWVLVLGGVLSFASGTAGVTAWTRWREARRRRALPPFIQDFVDSQNLALDRLR